MSSTKNREIKSLVSSSDESDGSQESNDDEGLIEDDTGETQSLLANEVEALNERNISISSGLSTYFSLSSQDAVSNSSVTERTLLEVLKLPHTSGCVIIKGFCQNGHQFCWSSSEFHTNKNHANIYDSNLLLKSAIVLSGNSCVKIKMLCDFMQYCIISETTFYSYRREFICPAVNEYYIMEQVCLSYIVTMSFYTQ